MKNFAQRHRHSASNAISPKAPFIQLVLRNRNHLPATLAHVRKSLPTPTRTAPSPRLETMNLNLIYWLHNPAKERSHPYLDLIIILAGSRPCLPEISNLGHRLIHIHTSRLLHINSTAVLPASSQIRRSGTRSLRRTSWKGRRNAFASAMRR